MRAAGAILALALLAGNPGGPAGPVECRRGEITGALVCTILPPGPAVWLKEITVELARPERAGYRLYGANSGRWLLTAAGEWPAGERRHTLTAISTLPPLRLELYGPNEPPRIAGVSAGPLYQPPLGSPLRVTAMRLGFRQILPATVRISLAALWRVRAPGAKPGEVVRLELPAEVYDEPLEFWGEQRLTAGDGWVPFMKTTLPEPAPIFLARGLRPRPSSGGGESRIDLLLPEGGLPMSLLQLTASPGAPFSRRIFAEASGSRHGPALAAKWTCAPGPLLPCREDLELGRRESARRLTLRFEDGADPPLPAVDVALWRQRETLVFVWPAAQPVRFMVGPRPQDLPAFDPQIYNDALLREPWRPAYLERRGNPFRLPLLLALAGFSLLPLLLTRRKADRVAEQER